MLEKSNESKIRDAIKERLAVDPAESDSAIASGVMQAQPQLVTAWVTDLLTAMVRGMRRKLPDPDQLELFPLDLSARLPVRAGFLVMREATMGKLKESEKLMQKKRIAAAKRPRSGSMHGKLCKLIEAMTPYSMANRRLTVERYYELRRQGVPPPSVRDWHMSETMRRYWEGKSPEERSAIAYRRKRRKR